MFNHLNKKGWRSRSRYVLGFGKLQTGPTESETNKVSCSVRAKNSHLLISGFPTRGGASGGGWIGSHDKWCVQNCPKKSLNPKALIVVQCENGWAGPSCHLR